MTSELIGEKFRFITSLFNKGSKFDKGIFGEKVGLFSKIFGDKIIINAVAPSPVETDMLEVIPLERREAFLKNVITKRFATPLEVAKTILWLATESPEYINGSCIDINNGSFPR